MELKRGDRVYWRDSPNQQATVTGVSGDGLLAAVLWDGDERGPRAALEDVINLRKVV